jgi:protein-tyrosine phosphatase
LSQPEFVDIHCHLLPGIDDGAKSWDETAEMARMAVADGITAVIATPHQLGSYSHNRGSDIRARVEQLNHELTMRGIPLEVAPGADVRIEVDMLARLRSGHVLTLADKGKHVLLELPHELYFPLDEVLDQLHRHHLTGILSHPERNQGLLKQPQLIQPLVERGCLMQVTAGSLLGAFGPASQQMAQWMVEQRLAHFLATDAHGPRSRRPLLQRAYGRTCELAGVDVAQRICCENPRAVWEGEQVEVFRRRTVAARWRWMSWRRAA